MTHAATAHPGGGSDRTIADERHVSALEMLYIGRLVSCSIDYSFTPQKNFFFLHEKSQHRRFMPVVFSEMFITVYWVYVLMLLQRQLTELTKIAKTSTLSFIECLL